MSGIFHFVGTFSWWARFGFSIALLITALIIKSGNTVYVCGALGVCFDTFARVDGSSRDYYTCSSPKITHTYTHLNNN